MVKTKAVREPVDTADGDRILITRYWARGRTRKELHLTAWEKRVAPSKELLADWKSGTITWSEYEERYLFEVAPHKDVIQQLAYRATTHTVTLLCFEPEHDPHCHRHILKRLVDAEIPEPTVSGF